MSKRNYENLAQLLGDRACRYVENDSLTPILVEKVEGQPLISLSHAREQHGELVVDPEVIFLVRDGTARPVYFRSDSARVEHATVEGYFGDAPVLPHLQKPLDIFCAAWLRVLEEQGFVRRARELAAQEADRRGPAALGSQASDRGENGRSGAQAPRRADGGPDLDDGPQIEH